MSTEEVKPITLKKLPLLLNKKILLKRGIKPFNRNIKFVKSFKNSFQEDVIYTSKAGDFTSGEARNMTIVNRLNVLTKTSRTVAKCQSHSGEFFEKTSEEITKLIGQNNYNILFSSLCSIINHELKIRSINSILTVPKTTTSVSCQTANSDIRLSLKKVVVESSCQTNETYSEDLKKFKPRRRNKRQPQVPYVVKDTPEIKKPRRIVITPNNFEMILSKDVDNVKKESQTKENSLPELGAVFDEDSNNSMGKFSSLSISTIPDLMVNPMKIFTNVDKHTRNITDNVNQQEFTATEPYKLENLDSTSETDQCNSKLPLGMKDLLHMAPSELRIKLILRQGLKDWNYCLTRDSDNHLPIHVAVLTNDVDLLRRQCLVLKMRDTSVDVTADGLTPLKMSLFQENTDMTAVLLQHGADPLETDEEERTYFHIAAEMASEHLQILVHYCQQNARKILQETDDLWKPGYENKCDAELEAILFTHINKSFDSQGYSPLMLASKLGRYNNVMTLTESCKQAVNIKMPNSGNTALYLAVGAACMDSAERGNKAKIVDHFRKTVEILVEHGADPNIDNFAGSNVNDLLTEFNIAELSMLIANKLTSVRYFDGQLPDGIKGSYFMLVKDDKGKVDLKEVKERKPLLIKSPEKSTTVKEPPVILENVSYNPPQVKTVNSASVSTPPTLPSKPKQLSKPVETAKDTSNSIKQDNVNATQSYTPIVKKFTLNKPLLIKSKVINNKRKIDIEEAPKKNKKSNMS